MVCYGVSVGRVLEEVGKGGGWKRRRGDNHIGVERLAGLGGVKGLRG
jgi:hypothetical protein